MRCRTPEVFDVDPKRFEDVARRAKAALDPKDAELIEKVFDSYQYLAEVIGEKSMSIARLQKLLFGAKTEKTDQVVGKSDPSPAAPLEQESAKDADDAEKNAADEKPPPKGHGRNAAEAYQGAERIVVPQESLSAGDPCPECGQGTLYEKRPAVVVRITGQAPLSAKRYELQRLRCGLCGQLFTAPLPQEAGPQKYDAKAGAMIGLLKYGCGLPFNRVQGLQGHLEIPLPASTQWDVVFSFAPAIHPAFDELIRQAAQGDVVYHDDTTVRILALMGEHRQTLGDDPDRKGLFTSGVVATRDGHRIALFFSSTRHAGENLVEVLKRRSAELDPPIQMCDALSRNMPKELKTILANCLAHARRQFVDVHDRFPEECRTVLEALKVVYHTDAIARDKGLSPEERLAFHQAQSQPVMTELRAWLKRQFEEKRVEPNSALGGAIRYLKKHWAVSAEGRSAFGQ